MVFWLVIKVIMILILIAVIVSLVLFFLQTTAGKEIISDVKNEK